MSTWSQLGISARSAHSVGRFAVGSRCMAGSSWCISAVLGRGSSGQVA